MANQSGSVGACALPISQYKEVLMAHGGGGRLMQQLLDGVFFSAFEQAPPENRHDGAILDPGGHKLAFTTDSYVVKPLFFPGGNIGTLAVNGTVNDLAMCGARPKYLSCGFIIEEGLPIADLCRIATAMRGAADDAGVRLVTGDTKVVDRGKGDGVFINTSGIGIIEHDLAINPGGIKPGDAILVNGDIGRHGMAIMAAREHLSFESEIESDCAPLAEPVLALLEAGISVHCLRDATRGGLASVLVELAQASKAAIRLDEKAIPVREDVHAACEILGFEPLYVANEGRFVAFVPRDETERALAVLREHPVSEGAAVIGEVKSDPAGAVTMTTLIGSSRVVDMLSGEQLPRIC